MYNTNFAHTIYSNKIFVAAAKLYELIKLRLKPANSKNDKSKEYLPYILNAVSKGYTVLDIGTHKRAYFFELFKISKLPGRLIAFEKSPGIYNYLYEMKQLMNLHNIFIEQLFISGSDRYLLNANKDEKKEKVTGATIIDIKARINKEENESSAATIDNYCSANFIIPALIKFKIERNDLQHLQGARQILQKYKPEILIECAEGTVSREALLTTFKFLADLNYSGYFILDTLKIPLRNFDFNIYQNEVLGFYCNNFIFQ